MTAKPAGEPRPHWTLEDFDDATMTVVELREDGRFRAHVLRDAAERIVAALNTAETRAAQPGDAPKLTADALVRDLAMLVSRLAIRLPDGDSVRVRAIEFLARKGLAGNLLRIIPETEPPLASRSTPAAPATASTEALIAAGDALRKTLDALIEKWYDRLNNIYGWGESADCLQECAEELRAAVAALHPASATQAALAATPPALTADQLAQRFHETYERLAPSFGYETRRDSAVPWESVPEKNRKLMVAVCAELLPVARPGGEGTQG